MKVAISAEAVFLLQMQITAITTTAATDFLCRNVVGIQKYRKHQRRNDAAGAFKVDFSLDKEMARRTIFCYCFCYYFKSHKMYEMKVIHLALQVVPRQSKSVE